MSASKYVRKYLHYAPATLGDACFEEGFQMKCISLLLGLSQPLVFWGKSLFLPHTSKIKAAFWPLTLRVASTLI